MSSFTFWIGFINVFRVARQRRPAKRTHAATEQRAHVRWHKAGKIECIRAAFFLGHLTDVVAVVESGNALLVELKHGFHVHAHGFLRRVAHTVRIGPPPLKPLLERPADRQIAIDGIMRAGLVGHGVRLDPAPDHLGQNFRCIAQQRDRDRRALLRILFYPGERVIQITGLLVHVAGAQAHVDPALLALDVQRARASQACCERLRATHTTEPRGQYPFTLQAAAVMLAAHFHECFVRPLHDPLASDVDPRAGGHLAVHHQALSYPVR